MNRTHNNGELRITDVNKKVELIGWVAKKRNLGALVFVDLRDRHGITQVIFDESFNEQLKDVKNEYILDIKGTVVERSSKNPDMPTGDIEIQAEEVKIVNKAATTPMIIADETDALEETRMKYRYLDLRRPALQKNIMRRAKIVRAIHEYLDSEEFVEIETPYLNKSIAEVNFWQETFATVIAIKRNGNIIMSPGPKAVFRLNDIFYYTGNEDCYRRVQEFMYPKI